MKRLALVCNLLFILIGILSVPLALTSVMLFDAPGSENNTYLWVTFWSTVALPFICLGSVSYSLYLYFKAKNYGKAFWVAVILPLLDIAILGISFALIQIFCAGNFSCAH